MALVLTSEPSFNLWVRHTTADTFPSGTPPTLETLDVSLLFLTAVSVLDLRLLLCLP